MVMPMLFQEENMTPSLPHWTPREYKQAELGTYDARIPALADIIEYVEFDNLPGDSKAAKKLLYTIERYYLDPDGILYHIWIPGGKRVPTPKSQLVVPSSLRHEVPVNAHDVPTGGHLGVSKTYAKLRDRYFWLKMFMDVQHWCLSCEHCAMKKSPSSARRHHSFQSQ